jgi:hypothetical protein
MEVLEVVLYVILTLILLALIGVLSWLIYDYYEYKKAVKSKINDTVAQSEDSNSLLKKEVITDYDNKFNIHSEYIKSTSNILRDEYRIYANNTSNILKDEYRIYANNTSNILRNEYMTYVNNTSNILRPEYMTYVNNTSNILRPEYMTYVNNTSNILRPEYMTKLDNSSSNLNKFFSFGVNNDNSIVNSKIHNRTWDLSDNESLRLMRNTIATNNLVAEKGAKIYTDSGTTVNSSKGLELCDKLGANCWNIYVDNSGDLKAANPNDTNYSLSFTTLGTQ